jgi:hypothetical protein
MGITLPLSQLGVAGQDLNQVSESSRSITIDDGENVDPLLLAPRFLA